MDGSSAESSDVIRERSSTEQLRNAIFPRHGIDDSREIMQGVRDSQSMGYANEHVLSETDGKGLREPEIRTDFGGHFPDHILIDNLFHFNSFWSG
jgi:hypothetical protein